MLAPLPGLPAEFLLGAPETLRLHNQTFVLKTTLWRDMMPTVPSFDQPIIGIIKIETVDSSAITGDIDSDGVYIVYKGDVWRSHYDKDPPPDHPDSAPFRLLKIMRNGPKWGPKIYVDVIVRIIAGGNLYFLRASNQYVDATY